MSTMPDLTPARPDANRTAKLIDELRRDLGLSDSQLASETGTTEGTVQRWQRRFDRAGRPVWSTLPSPALIIVTEDGTSTPGPLAVALGTSARRLARRRRLDENERREWNRLLRLGVVEEDEVDE